MSDLPLPGLRPDDPENRLSFDARQRIARAFLEYNLIRQRALSAIDIGGYWNTPQEETEKRKANLEAIRIVLRTEAEEYGKLDLPGREFRDIIRGRIEEAVDSLGFSHVHLEADLKTPLPRKLVFTDPDKIRELARKGEAWGTSEARQMLELAIEQGRGGVYLNLTPVQYRRLRCS